MITVFTITLLSLVLINFLLLLFSCNKTNVKSTKTEKPIIKLEQAPLKATGS